MYNRYIQSDRGNYVPISDPSHGQQGQCGNNTDTINDGSHKPTEKSQKRTSASLESFKEFWNTLAGRLHLDPGDLILLAMLYFLYRENADEELLIALGLLLLL